MNHMPGSRSLSMPQHEKKLSTLSLALFFFLLYICPQTYDFHPFHCYSMCHIQIWNYIFLFQCFSVCFSLTWCYVHCSALDVTLFSMVMGCCDVCAGVCTGEFSAWQPVSYTSITIGVVVLTRR